MSEPKYVTEEEFSKYKKEMDKKLSKQNAKPRPPREPNDYNLYIKEKIPEFKAENPKLSNKEVFTHVAKAWEKDKVTWQRPKLVAKDDEEQVEEQVAPVLKKLAKKPVKVLSPASDE